MWESLEKTVICYTAIRHAPFQNAIYPCMLTSYKAKHPACLWYVMYCYTRTCAEWFSLSEFTASLCVTFTYRKGVNYVMVVTYYPSCGYNNTWYITGGRILPWSVPLQTCALLHIKRYGLYYNVTLYVVDYIRYMQTHNIFLRYACIWFGGLRLPRHASVSRKVTHLHTTTYTRYCVITYPYSNKTFFRFDFCFHSIRMCRFIQERCTSTS